VELWRTHTIARPGERGGDTWDDLPLLFRGGGDAGITGSYDPDTKLIYWGVAQPKPWARVSRGTDGDALYTSSTLALDPDTGEIVWYHQFIPGETMDMDENFEQVLVDRDGQKNLFMMGKLGILWRIDRQTDEFLSAFDLGYQNILDVDPITGKVTYRPEKIPQKNVKIEFGPSHAGFKSWRAMSYSPETRAFYIPLNLNCMSGIYRDVPRKIDPETGEGRRVHSGLTRRINDHHPESGGNLGEFLAMDSESGKVGAIVSAPPSIPPCSRQLEASSLWAIGIVTSVGTTSRPASCCGRRGCPARSRAFPSPMQWGRGSTLPFGLGPAVVPGRRPSPTC